MLQRNERAASRSSSEVFDASLAALIVVILGLFAAISVLRSPADVHLTPEQNSPASEFHTNKANRITDRNKPGSGSHIRRLNRNATDVRF
jgi:hypothetical protein